MSSNVHYRVYGKAFTRDRTALPDGRGARDDWHTAQGGFRLDWDASEVHQLALQGDLDGGKIAQPSASDIAVSGGGQGGGRAHRFSGSHLGPHAAELEREPFRQP